MLSLVLSDLDDSLSDPVGVAGSLEGSLVELGESLTVSGKERREEGEGSVRMNVNTTRRA